MPFTPDKREYLKQLGYAEDAIAQMESTLLGTSKALVQAGVESKEATPATDAVAPVAETPLTRAEIAQTLSEIVGPLVTYTQNLENVNTELTKSVVALSERLGGVEAQLKELSVADSAKVAKAANATPAASLSEMLGAALTKGNQVNSTSALIKSGPTQTETPPPSVSPSGFLNSVIAKSHAAPTATQ